ncbi:unannotated protein [freshwater metagenome]|uniref:Unannotated protein n=1 Tax=freshwater metagenome TaxID=449393 RepID=A0A6J7L0B0_9ZZZZ|nr:hypothetical protein [Actinomycetota bacterium]MSW37809.1 hypothetical protein [Actinomycetota bacterium]MSX38369.1 hypothetical protein [Actinomycetota bacterium]
MARPRFQLVPGARLLGLSDGGGVGWRLLGANNRELGRSALSYPDAEEALESVQRVRVLADDGDGHIVHDHIVGLWLWHLDDRGLAAAASGRGFRYERECRYNLEQFRATAPVAPTSEADGSAGFSWQRVTLEAPLMKGAS